MFLPILATLIVAAKRTGFLHSLTYLSYARYANEAYVIANAQRSAYHNIPFEYNFINLSQVTA